MDVAPFSSLSGPWLSVRQASHLQLVGGLSVFDPSLALSLGIDHQRVAAGLGGHDAVLDGQLVAGQTLRNTVPYRSETEAHSDGTHRPLPFRDSNTD